MLILKTVALMLNLAQLSIVLLVMAETVGATTSERAGVVFLTLVPVTNVTLIMGLLVRRKLTESG